MIRTTLLSTALLGAVAATLAAQVPADSAARDTVPNAALAPVAPVVPDSAHGITLEQAIRMAQEKGYRGRTARNTFESSQWARKGFDATFLPKLSLTGTLPSYSRAISPVTQPDGNVRYVGNSSTSASVDLRLDQPLTFTGGSIFVTSNLNRYESNGQNSFLNWSSTPFVAGISQPLFQLNAYAWDRKAQTLTNEVADRAYVESREEIALSTVGAFFELFSARANLKNVKSNIAINDTLYKVNKGRYQVGKIGENELLQSELQLLRARADEENAQITYDRAVSALRLQLGLSGDASLDLIPPTTIPQVSPDTAIAVKAALHNSSAAVGRDLRSLNARRGVRAAKLSSGFNATVSAQAGYNQTAPLFDDVYRNLLSQQSFSLSVQMPLVQWGAGKARVNQAKIQERETENQLDVEREQARQEAFYAARGVDQSRRQLAIAAKADTVAAKRFEVAKNRYLIGKIDVNDFVVAQNEKDGALQSYMQALRAFWAAHYQLRRLTLYDFETGREIVTGQ